MYLSLLEVAESFGVSERTVEDWIRRDDLPGIRERGRWIFDRALVAAWGAARGVGARSGFLSLKKHATGAPVRIESLLRRGGVHRAIAPGDVPAILERVVLDVPGVSDTVAPLLRSLVGSPIGVNWAPVGLGTALPHLRGGAAMGPESGTVAVLFLTDPLLAADPTPDGVAVTRLWFFLAPTPRTHLEILARLSQGLRDGPLGDLLPEKVTNDDILRVLSDMDAQEAIRRSREP